MKYYLVILSEVESNEHDLKFYSFIEKNNLEYWRYTTYNWILCTPDNISTTRIVSEITSSYGLHFSLVLEITINDVGGLLPTNNLKNGRTPFTWFEDVRRKDYVPKWERVKKE